MSEHLSTIRDRVARGEPLATALAAHPETFPPLYLGLVRAGERSGDLAGAFTRLATQLEREEARSKLLSAAIYPALLAVVGTTACSYCCFVLPRFAGVLEGPAHIFLARRNCSSRHRRARSAIGFSFFYRRSDSRPPGRGCKPRAMALARGR
jgi:hypothetical protein